MGNVYVSLAERNYIDQNSLSCKFLVTEPQKFLWKMEDGREVAAIWYPRHIVASLLARLVGVRQWPGLDLLLAPSSASLTLESLCMFSSGKKNLALAGYPHHQVQKQHELIEVSVCPPATWSMHLGSRLSLLSIFSSWLPPCALQAPASDIKTIKTT